ncbi:MAG: hypothetical protein IJ446_00830 [Oscillospiraceae bacterium]|nr:hypothetical protein [Oscillospiraceae bacterium]
MKIKKRYIISCILLCIVSVLISIAVFHLEKGLSSFSKLNSTVSEKWSNTDIMVTKVINDPADLSEEDKDVAVNYLGKVCYIENGTYTAYNKTYWLNETFVYYGEAKIGDKISVYYKPDDPEKIACKAPNTSYLIGIIVLFIIDVVLIIVARILNRSLKENTFSDAVVSIMDIPICVLIIGFIICFFSGMLIGNISIDSSYTAINTAVVEEYESSIALQGVAGAAETTAETTAAK